MSIKNTASADTKVEGIELGTTEGTEAKFKRAPRAPRASTVERLEQALIDAKAKQSARAERRVGVVREALEAAEQRAHRANAKVTELQAELAELLEDNSASE